MAKEKEEVTVISYEVMDEKLVEYFERDAEVKALGKKQEEIKAQARVYANMNGTPDEKGSIKLELDNGKVQLIVRESISLNSKAAVAYFQEKGLLHLLKNVLRIDEAKLEEAIQNGEVTPVEIVPLLDRKKNTALYLRKLKAKDSVPKTDTANIFKKMVDALEI